MQKTCFSLFLLFSLAEAFGQTTPPILQASKYTRGIYRSYVEFLKNAPSLTTDFTFKTNSTAKKVENNQAVYHLVMLDSAIRKRDLKKFWGFSDGTNVFINETAISGNLSFRKLQGIGRYCYLFASPPDNYQYNPMTGIVGAAASNLPRMIDGDEPYVLNVNNGKFFLLNKKTLMTVLEKDPALLQEYELDEKRRRERTYIEYIKRYNENHLHEANLELWSDREVVVFRSLKKEIAEPTEILINDTLAITLKPNEVYRTRLQGEKAKFCSGEECTEISLIRKGVNYISTSLRKAGSNAIIRQVDMKEGEYWVGEIQNH